MDSENTVYTVQMPDHSAGNNIPKVLCVDVDTWWTAETVEFLESYLNKTADVEKPDNVDVPTVTPSTPDDVKTYPYLEDGTKMVVLDELKTATGYQTVSVSKPFRDALSQGYTVLHIELENTSDKTIQIALFNEEISFEDNKFVIDSKKNLENIDTNGNDYKWEVQLIIK